MTNDYLSACIYKSIEKGCLHCKSQLPCPALIVIAMRYAREMLPADPPCVTLVTESYAQ